MSTNSNMQQEYTISLFTEDHIGILGQITIILTRRQINIDSFTASESAICAISGPVLKKFHNKSFIKLSLLMTAF